MLLQVLVELVAAPIRRPAEGASNSPRDMLVFTALIVGLLSTLPYRQADAGHSQQVSQCFATKGNPFVSLQCGPRRHLTLLAALHGRHAENRSECHALEADCVEDQMRSFYDWQDCMGRAQCVMSVQQSWMPSCGNYSQFLQVDYACVPDAKLIDICKKGSYQLKDGYLRSPDYPDHYPHSRDCECTLRPSGTEHVFFSFLDLALEMTPHAECADWLLIEAGEGDATRTDLNCGEVLQNTKNVTIKGTPFRLHFHSDEMDHRSQAFRFNTRRKLKGFWIYFRPEPEANITMTCGPSKPKILRKLKPSPTRKPRFGDYYIGDGAGQARVGLLTLLAALGAAVFSTSVNR